MISVEEAQRHYRDGDSAHGFDHVLRVWRLALRIAREEQADMEVVSAAALLHDVARPAEQESGVCHAEAGAVMAQRILSGHPSSQVERVATAIAQHRYRGESGPTSPEARVLYDADKLDAIGAIGVARAYAVAGMQGQRVWAHVDQAFVDRPPSEGRGDLGASEHTPVHEYLFKLARLKERLFTETARSLAEGRHAFMVAFFEQLEHEVQGEC